MEQYKPIISPLIAPMYEEQSYDISLKEINRIALIDADRYKHVVTYAMYNKMYNEGYNRDKELLDEIINEYLYRDIFSKFKAKDYIFCFSAPSKSVFRSVIACDKEYKGNRKKIKDAYYYEGKFEDMAYVFEYVSHRYQTLYFNDLEADDILSMIQDEDATFIFSHDKDLKQVPGAHWDMNAYNLSFTSKEEGFHLLMKQVLLGDYTDHISGLKGFGIDKFEKIQHLEQNELFFVTIKQYIDKFGLLYGVDTFVEMWNLVSLKLNRGNWLREKYSKAFTLIETLKNNLQNE